MLNQVSTLRYKDYGKKNNWMDSVIVDYASKIESGLYSGSNKIAFFFT